MKTNRTRVRKKDRNDCNGIAFGRCRKSAGRVETTWWLEPMQITTKVGYQVYPLWQRKCVYFNAFYIKWPRKIDILIWQFDKKLLARYEISMYTKIFSKTCYPRCERWRGKCDNKKSIPKSLFTKNFRHLHLVLCLLGCCFNFFLWKIQISLTRFVTKNDKKLLTFLLVSQHWLPLQWKLVWR